MQTFRKLPSASPNRKNALARKVWNSGARGKPRGWGRMADYRLKTRRGEPTAVVPKVLVLDAQQVALELRDVRAIGWKRLFPVQALAVDEPHLRRQRLPLAPALLAQMDGVAQLLVVLGFFPGQQRGLERFAQALVGKQTEDPVMVSFQNIGAGFDAGQALTHDGAVAAGDLRAVVFRVVVDDDGLIDAAQRFQQP